MPCDQVASEIALVIESKLRFWFLVSENQVFHTAGKQKQTRLI